MRKILFDIETDGLLEKVSTVWCLVMRDLETGETASYGPNYEDEPGLPGVLSGVRLLDKAELLAGHNIIDYDIPALRKLFPWAKLDPPVLRDTLIISKLCYPDIKALDFGCYDKWGMPKQYIGRHSLKAWGYRLRLHKIEYTDWCEENGLDPWECFRQEMLDYCIGDVDLNHKLFNALCKKKPPRGAVDREMDYAKIAVQMETNGFPFDEAKAQELWGVLVDRKAELEKKVGALFADWWVALEEVTPTASRRMKIPGLGTWRPRAKGKTLKGDHDLLWGDDPPGEGVAAAKDLDMSGQGVECIPVYEEFTEGEPYTKIELRTFNPKSREHIADRLKALYGWKPVTFGKNGKPKLDDEILEDLPFPPCGLLAEYFMVEKRIAQLAGGQQGWLKCVKETTRWGITTTRIHGRMNTIGTVTFRCSHSTPNMGQVPSVENGDGIVPYGHECRELFIPERGFKLLGVDASGLQLRGLAHNLVPYDGGRYVEIVTTGDVHVANQHAAQLDSRPRAKKFIYTFLFGGGGWKLGHTCGGVSEADILATNSETKGVKAAKRHLDYVGLPHTRENVAITLYGFAMKANFLKRTDGLEDLIKELTAEAKTNGYIVGLDGRHVPIRSPHAALNSKLMSDEAIICKEWKVIFAKEMQGSGHRQGVDYIFPHADVHDENQSSVRPEIAEEVGMLSARCVEQAGVNLGYKCPLAGEFKIGDSWAGTH